MCFDVPKIVRSLGCDHGHDEESRNGRDINIDVLDGYIRTPEVFQVISEKAGVPEGYRNPPGELMGHMGSVKRERAGQGRPRAPSPSGPNWTREGGRRPPFLLPHLLPFPLLVGLGKGIPTPTRRRTPPLHARHKGRPASPLAPLYTGVGAP